MLLLHHNQLKISNWWNYVSFSLRGTLTAPLRAGRDQFRKVPTQNLMNLDCFSTNDCLQWLFDLRLNVWTQKQPVFLMNFVDN